MATGDATDIASRLRRLLPRWFGHDENRTPVLNALLAGPAWALAIVHEWIAYAKLQTRIATATGGWLELIALDYLGEDFTRHTNETDAKYSRRIRKEIIRNRATRPAISQLIYDLTGQRPRIYEPFNPLDCGGYGTTAFYLGRSGRWGSSKAPGELFIYTPLPQGFGVPARGGWGSQTGGLGSPGPSNFSFISPDQNDLDGLTVPELLDQIARTQAAGVRVLVQFADPNVVYSPDEPPFQPAGPED